jgi:UPF0716 protein FxsA
MVLLVVLALLVVVPVVEIEVFIQVASAIGGWNALGLLILFSIVGGWLVRHEGFIVLRRLRDQVDGGRLPEDELIEGGLLLFAGVLMLTPGFVTGALGLLLIFPPTRILARMALKRRLHARVAVFGVGPPPGTGRRPGRDGDDVIDI